MEENTPDVRFTQMNDKDLLSILEFSELVGIRQSKLRHYDEIKLFEPIMRGENNYRYYSSPQTIAVNLVTVMRNANIPLKKIAEIKKNKTPESVLELFSEHEVDLNRALFNLQQAYSIIHTYCGLIREGLLADEKVIAKRRMTALPIELGDVNDFSSGYFYDSFFEFLKLMISHKINAAYPIGGYYDDFKSFAEAPGKPARFFSHTPTGRDLKEEGDYLVGYSRGYYGEPGDLPERLATYAKENKLSFTGPVYEVYLHNEISVDDPDRYLIQVSVPIKKSRS